MSASPTPLPRDADAPPYASAIDHLRDLAVEVALRLKRFIVLHGHRMIGSEGDLDDVQIATNEALAFFGRRLRDLPVAPEAAARERTLDHLADQLAEVRARIDAREAASEAAGIRLPLHLATERFGLDPVETCVLATLAVAEMDTGLRRVCRYAVSDARLRHLPLGFLHDLLAQDPASHADLWRLWAPDAPLVAHRLVVLGDADHDRGLPLLERAVRLWPRLASFLRGEHAVLDPALDGLATVVRTARRLRDLVLSEEAERRLAAACRAPLDPAVAAPRLALWGPDGVGKRTIAAALGAARDSVAIALDGRRAAQRGATELLRLALSESRLAHAPLFLDLGELDEPAAAWWRDALHDARDALAAHPTPLVAASHRPLPWLPEAVAGLAEIPLDPPGVTRVAAFWRACLEGALEGGPVDAAALDVEDLAATYRLSPGRVVQATETFRQQLALERRTARAVTPQRATELLWAAARRQLAHRLGALAEPVVTRLGLEDVVLPPNVHATVHEILAYAHHQRRVFEDWGFGQRVASGRGLAVLFSGPPGTGKTLVSGILARELGRELFRVDVSRVVDKYIGETEKNLARIFDEAERAQAVLLFDEADSLFSRRTAVESSHDRYANLNVNYLLQRMEDFAGVSILTTNLESALDEAFRRRLRFSVRFPEPDAGERAQLWRAMIPEQAGGRLAADVDWDELGEAFELTGGYIRNAVLRAAMAAAAEDRPIGRAHLIRAAVSIYEELGRVAPAVGRYLSEELSAGGARSAGSRQTR